MTATYAIIIKNDKPIISSNIFTSRIAIKNKKKLINFRKNILTLKIWSLKNKWIRKILRKLKKKKIKKCSSILRKFYLFFSFTVYFFFFKFILSSFFQRIVNSTVYLFFLNLLQVPSSSNDTMNCRSFFKNKN